MSKKKDKLREKKIKYSIRDNIYSYLKKYAMIMLISIPIIFIVNYLLAIYVSGFNGAVVVFVTLCELILACFIGVIIFNKIEEKRMANSTKEKERDPFAD